MGYEFNLIIYKNFFIVYCNSNYSVNLIKDFNKRFTTFTYLYDYKIRKKKRVIDRIYIAGNKDRKEYRYNIKYIKDLMWLFRTYDVNKDSINIINGNVHSATSLNLSMNGKYDLRDYQETAFNNLITATTPTVLIDHQTGKGKGIMAISAMCELNKATAILILPKYIDKWIEELKELTNITDDDIMVIKGGKDLRLAIELALANEYSAKVIIFSNRTVSNYIKEYEVAEIVEEEFTYPVTPDTLMETFKIGTLMIDEVHQEFYSVYKASLYFNVDMIIGMSATLESDDAKKTEFYNALFPPKVRLANLEYDRYTDLHVVEYHIDNYNRIRSTDNMGYKHIMFEQSISRHNIQLRNYVYMIKHYIKVGYIDRMVKGDKLLIFAASIDFCSLLTNIISEDYPDYKVRRYVEDDPYENVMEGEIIITTVLSAGTALDIKGLITVLQTISIKSKPANLQAFGRLRKKDGKQMRYYYFFSKQIPKQFEYHKYRFDLLKQRSKTVFLEEYKKPI